MGRGVDCFGAKGRTWINLHSRARIVGAGNQQLNHAKVSRAKVKLKFHLLKQKNFVTITKRDAAVFTGQLVKESMKTIHK